MSFDVFLIFCYHGYADSVMLLVSDPMLKADTITRCSKKVDYIISTASVLMFSQFCGNRSNCEFKNKIHVENTLNKVMRL